MILGGNWGYERLWKDRLWLCRVVELEGSSLESMNVGILPGLERKEFLL